MVIYCPEILFCFSGKVFKKILLRIQRGGDYEEEGCRNRRRICYSPR